MPTLLARADIYVLYRFQTGLKLGSMHGWRPPGLRTASCFGQSTKLAESGVPVSVKEFDLLHDLLAKLHDANGEIDIVCGYRTPWSNNFLRSHTGGVAQHSQHMEAKAIDIRIPGVPTAEVRDAALSMARGGVGYYPASNFVHVDVGPVRHWSYE